MLPLLQSMRPWFKPLAIVDNAQSGPNAIPRRKTSHIKHERLYACGVAATLLTQFTLHIFRPAILADATYRTKKGLWKVHSLICVAGRTSWDSTAPGCHSLCNSRITRCIHLGPPSATHHAQIRSGVSDHAQFYVHIVAGHIANEYLFVRAGMVTQRVHGVE